MVKTKAIVLILICLTTLTYSAHVRAQDSQPRVLFSVDKNGKSGYIDDKGKLVIPLIFDGAGDFSEGLAPVKVHDQWGYIDETGKIVIEPLFSRAYEFSEGLARVQVEGDKYGMHGKWGFIDKSGNWVIKPQYGELTGVDSESQGFREGLAIIEIDYQKGFIDKSGRQLIKPQFSYVYHFSEGLVSVSAGLHDGATLIDRVSG
jgi:hypothetical protein